MHRSDIKKCGSKFSQEVQQHNFFFIVVIFFLSLIEIFLREIFDVTFFFIKVPNNNIIQKDSSARGKIKMRMDLKGNSLYEKNSD